MREYLFRGKTIENGEWVEGSLVKYTDEMPDKKEEHFRIQETNYGFTENTPHEFSCDYMSGFDEEVIPETVGQYTGLCDKNGNKIFEGDILKGLFGVFSIYWNEDFCGFDWSSPHHYTSESFSGFADDYEIIGNIHDNKNLLEEQL